MTSIDYVPENDSLKVFLRMYYDDFLLDLSMSGENRGIDFFNSGSQDSKEVMERYINKRLIIKVNKKQLDGKLYDLEIVENEVKLGINYITSKKPGLLTVSNLIMTGLYNDQSNLIIIKVGNFEEGVKLTPEKTGQTFKIK